MLSEARLQEIHNWEDGDSSPWDKERLDPYRCPICDKSMERLPGTSMPIQMACPDHGLLKPRYDARRAALAASESLGPQPCGCSTDSGLFTVHCAAHDPAQIILDLLAERELLLAMVECR